MKIPKRPKKTIRFVGSKAVLKYRGEITRNDLSGIIDELTIMRTRLEFAGTVSVRIWRHKRTAPPRSLSPERRDELIREAMSDGIMELRHGIKPKTSPFSESPFGVDPATGEVFSFCGREPVSGDLIIKPRPQSEPLNIFNDFERVMSRSESWKSSTERNSQTANPAPISPRTRTDEPTGDPWTTCTCGHAEPVHLQTHLGSYYGYCRVVGCLCEALLIKGDGASNPNPVDKK